MSSCSVRGYSLRRQRERSRQKLTQNTRLCSSTIEKVSPRTVSQLMRTGKACGQSTPSGPGESMSERRAISTSRRQRPAVNMA